MAKQAAIQSANSNTVENSIFGSIRNRFECSIVSVFQISIHSHAIYRTRCDRERVYVCAIRKKALRTMVAQ